MSYRVNDIFYSLQGEGRNSGRAALFVRFSGCNLKCSFCDTDFSTFREMTAVDICEALQRGLAQQCLIAVRRAALALCADGR